MKITKDLGKLTTTQAAMARALKISSARVNQLAQEGTFVVADDKGALFVIESVLNFARRDKALVREETENDIDFAKEHARLEKLKADKEEIRVAQLQGDLYEAKVVELVMQEIYTTLRTQLLGIPSKVAARLPADVRGRVNELVNQEIESCLAEVSSFSPEMFETEADDE